MPGWLKWAGDPTAFIRVTAIEFRQSVQASEISELFEYLPAIESISFFADPQQFDEAMIQKLSELKALKEIVFWSVREPNDKDIDYAVYHPPVSNKPFQTLRERLPNVNVHSRLPF
ncbi:MAG TPA: hypothetical protein VFE46_17730 [Pirellulales bacterium]|nr:hypothetical protein [Pirellulales bacterium]